MEFRKEGLKDHSVAPYNFISLPGKCISAYDSIADIPKHNELSDDLLSGCIELKIEAKTPIIVAASSENNEKKFFKNPVGKEVIPGNTIRGLIRTNVAILSKSNISDDIEDQRFFFRSFDRSNTAIDYKERLQIKGIKENGISYSVAQTVKAGYIYKKGNEDYVIVPAKSIKGEQYYRVSEQYLRLMDKGLNINYMYTDRIKDLVENKNKYKGKVNGRIKGEFLKRICNRNYKPYYKELSFSLKDKRTINKIAEKDVLSNNGYIISSSYIAKKLGHYVINQCDFQSTDILELKGEMLKHISFYEDDCIRTKKVKNNEEENFFTLPKKIGKENGKPIFYGKFKGNIYFGFTPYFRIPYDKSINDGIGEGYKNNEGISYVEGLFGFTNKGEDKLSYKGRLSFEDFNYCGEVAINNIESKKYYDVVLGEPKASCFQNYLVQKGGTDPKNLNTYNSKEFNIRGIKSYWQKNYIDAVATGKEKMDIRLNPLKAGSKFVGKIRFNNLKKDELGLILWALNLDDKATENIGMGKPYGFGRVKLDIANVNIENLEEKYNNMNLDFYNVVDTLNYKDYYKEKLKKDFNIDINKEISVEELIKMKTTVISKEKYNEGRYMEISNKEVSRDLSKEFALRLPLLDIRKQVNVIEGKANINNGLNKTVINKKNNNFQNKKQKNTNKQHKISYLDTDDDFSENEFSKLKNLFNS